MKKLIFLLSVCLMAPMSTTLLAENPINPVIGDISYKQKFGISPTSTVNEDLRIRTHLLYVLNELSSRPVENLSPQMQWRRKYMLNLLGKYIVREEFPRNYDKQERIPCFIDKNGRICAVGYLVEQTAGRHVAEYINANYQYEKLKDMHDPLVDLWIKNSGLTEDECAMIQPAYGPLPDQQNNHVTPAYGVSSSVFSAANISLTTINGIQLANGSKSLALPIIGIASGIGQISLGAAMYPAETYDYWGYYTTNEELKTVSMVNIGVGTSTVIISTWNLVNYFINKKKNKTTSWSLYTYPASKTDMGVGFTFSSQF